MDDKPFEDDLAPVPDQKTLILVSDALKYRMCQILKLDVDDLLLTQPVILYALCSPRSPDRRVLSLVSFCFGKCG